MDPRARSSLLVLAVGGLLPTSCLSDRDLGGFDDPTSTTEGPFSPGSSPPTETEAPTSTGSSSDDSAGTAESGITTSPAGAPTSSGDFGECGDGVEDPGEQCDDGNDQNADGCNVDCVESGSWLWQVPVVAAARVAVGPEDRLYALTFAGSVDSDLSLYRFSSSGDLIDLEFQPTGFELTTADVYGLQPIRVATDGSWIVSFRHGSRAGERERTFRTGEDGWSRISPRSPFHFDVLDDDTVLGVGGTEADDTVFQRLDEQPGPDDDPVVFEVSFPPVSAAFRGPGRSLVVGTGAELDVVDENALSLWTARLPGELRGGGVIPTGELLGVGSLGETFPRQLFLGRWSETGVELDLVYWPDEPGDIRISVVAVDGAGNLVVGLLDSILKFSPDLELLWRQADAVAYDLAVDSTGAIYASREGWISKYAP